MNFKILFLSLLVGCGGTPYTLELVPVTQEEINRRNILVHDSLISANSERIELLEHRLDVVENAISYIGSENVIRALNFRITIDELNANIGANKIKIDALTSLLDSTVADFDSALVAIDDKFENALSANEVYYSDILNDVFEEISILNDSVIRIIYPCGVNKSEEVLLDTLDGLVAYFEKGTSKYLSIIKDGNYSTTDGFKCNFKVLDGKLVVK
jgi:hypothetical protein